MINEYLLNAVCSTSATGSFLSFLSFHKVIRRALQDVKVVMELERFGRDLVECQKPEHACWGEGLLWN